MRCSPACPTPQGEEATSLHRCPPGSETSHGPHPEDDKNERTLHQGIGDPLGFSLLLPNPSLLPSPSGGAEVGRAFGAKSLGPKGRHTFARSFGPRERTAARSQGSRKPFQSCQCPLQGLRRR